MPTEEVLKTEEAPAFDPAAFARQRNEAMKPGMPKPEAAPPAKPVEARAPSKPASSNRPSPDSADTDDDGEEPDHKSGSTRASRRETNRLREQLGYERGKREALEELVRQGLTPKAAQAQVAAPVAKEPQRADFANDAEYSKAIAAWAAGEARKEMRGELEEDAKFKQFLTVAEQNQKKYEIDQTMFEDWSEAQEQLNSIAIPSEERHQLLLGFFADSGERARIMYWLAKHPEEAKEMMKMDDGRCLRALSRLEGEVKYVYPDQETSGAAQARQAPSGKDRTPPEKPEKGVATAAERDFRKPRPSTEVAARGGSTPPEEPAIGSAAWMAKRNQMQFGR